MRVVRESEENLRNCWGQSNAATNSNNATAVTDMNWSHSTNIPMDERFNNGELVQIDAEQQERENELLEDWLERGDAIFANIVLAVLNDAPIPLQGSSVDLFKRIVKQKFANGKGVAELMRMAYNKGRAMGGPQFTGRPQFSYGGRGSYGQYARRPRPYRGRGAAGNARNCEDGRPRHVPFRMTATMARGRAGFNRGGLLRSGPARENARLLRERLDRELDAYMASSHAALDRQLEEYMATRQLCRG